MKFNPINTLDKLNKDETLSLRTARTSFLRKIADAYGVLKGETTCDMPLYHEGVNKALESIRERVSHRHGSYDEEHCNKLLSYELNDKHKFSNVSPGIFDYLTLGLFRFIHYANNRLEIFRSTNVIGNTELHAVSAQKLKILLAIPMAIIYVANLVGNGIIRPVMSGLLTAISLPLIGLIQLASRASSYAMRSMLNNEVLVKATTNKESKGLGSYNLGNFLKLAKQNYPMIDLIRRDDDSFEIRGSKIKDGVTHLEILGYFSSRGTEIEKNKLKNAVEHAYPETQFKQ